MTRTFILLLITILLAGCVAETPTRTADEFSQAAMTLAGELSPARAALTAATLDESLPKIDVIWPRDGEVVLLYAPGTMSQFAAQFRVVAGGSDLLRVYLTISRAEVDGPSAPLSLVGVCDTLSDEGIGTILFNVDAADLYGPEEHVLTALAVDSKGHYGIARQMVRFYWERE